MPRARGTAISLLGCSFVKERKNLALTRRGNTPRPLFEVDQKILLQLRRVSVVAHGSELGVFIQAASRLMGFMNLCTSFVCEVSAENNKHIF